MGRYWLDAANTETYDGHDLYNLRLNYPIANSGIGKSLEIYANINNLADTRYAEIAGLSQGDKTYTVGLPRMVYVGVQAKW